MFEMPGEDDFTSMVRFLEHSNTIHLESKEHSYFNTGDNSLAMNVTDADFPGEDDPSNVEDDPVIPRQLTLE